MSGLQKTKKLNINLQSCGSFLNIKKPKFLSLGKSYNINTIKLKKNELDISHDTFHYENITRQTESSSKDEVIKALKERLTILEKKVKILEIENSDSILKKNVLNLSYGNNKSINKEMKLNIKIFKHKKKFKNALNLSKSEIEKSEINDKNIFYKNKIIFNKDNKQNDKNFNRNLNFFDSINTSGYHTNINIIKNKIRISKSASKYKNFTIIPKKSSKKKIFVDILKKKLIRFSTLENEKIDEFKNNRKENNSKNIPKVPNKEKYTNNSEKVKKHERKLNEIKIQNFNDNKTKYTLFNKFSRLKSCDLNNLNHINLKSNFDPNNNSKNFKNKLENIKNRTKKLLEFYADHKISNINFNV